MTSRRLALFDLDHTLLPLDSDHQWAQYLANSGRAGDPVEALRRNEELMDRYNAGDLTAQQAAEFMLGLLAAHPPHLLAVWHEDFMQRVIRPAMTDRAIELVRHCPDCTRLWCAAPDRDRPRIHSRSLHWKNPWHAQFQRGQSRARERLALGHEQEDQ